MEHDIDVWIVQRICFIYCAEIIWWYKWICEWYNGYVLYIVLESFGGIRNGYVRGAMDIFSYSIKIICIIELKRIWQSCSGSEITVDILGPTGQIILGPTSQIILGPSGQITVGPTGRSYWELRVNHIGILEIPGRYQTWFVTE